MQTIMYVTGHDKLVTSFFDITFDAAQQWLAQHPPNTFASAEFIEAEADDEIRTRLEV